MVIAPQRQLLDTLLSERILIMDGAMGTMIPPSTRRSGLPWEAV
jgi:methionine synthase I (cobalamin-dependent)